MAPTRSKRQRGPSCAIATGVVSPPEVAHADGQAPAILWSCRVMVCSPFRRSGQPMGGETIEPQQTLPVCMSISDIQFKE